MNNELRIVKHLHSTMVRFIIGVETSIPRSYINIYIPLWLDLLYKCCYSLLPLLLHLHSTMVRFIIVSVIKFIDALPKFTFHYG